MAGFAGVLVFAAGYAEGDGPGTTGGVAVDELAHDADVGFLGELPVWAVVFLTEEGFELAGVQEGDVRLVGGIARHQGEGDAFFAYEDRGAVRAAEKSLECDGSGIVAVFSDLPGRLRLVAIASVTR